MRTAGELLGEALVSLGVERVFSDSPHPELGSAVTNVVVPEGVADLLADADGRIGPGPGASLCERRLRISSSPGGRADPRPVRSAAALLEGLVLAGRAVCGPLPGSAELELDLELSDEVPRGLQLRPTPVIAAERESEEIVIGADTVGLAGPGVLRSDAIGALRELARSHGLEIANTWGAKGVFDWRSPNHMGTVGLQARDFELLGFGKARRILSIGVDPDECRIERVAQGIPVSVLDPASLAALRVTRVNPSARMPSLGPNEFMRRMSAFCTPLRTASRLPLSPGRAVSDIRELLAGEDLLAGEPGLAGLWLARAFPTTLPGSVVVPARAAPGFAAAAALVASLREPARRALGVMAGPLDPRTERVLEAARCLERALVLEVWMDPTRGDTRALTSAGMHAELLHEAFSAGEVQVLEIPIASGDTDALVELAGPVVAWSGSDVGLLSWAASKES